MTPLASPIPWLTTAQAAAYLGIGVSTLQDWVRDGHLQPDGLTPGNRPRWRWHPEQAGVPGGT